MEQPPAGAGIQLANWYWKVVRQFVSERFGICLCRSSCLNWLHRLGFAFKRPKKRLLKADESKREAFVAEYAALWEEAQRTEARIFFADEAHFRADAELRGKWVLKGKPALVDSNSPRYGEKASYYSAVCLETGEVEWMELEGNSNSGTSAAFLTQLREKHPGPLRVIWDNAPAHRGEAVREYLRTPDLELRLVNPRFHEGRLCRATARTSTPMRPSGVGRERACPREYGGGHRQSVLGQQGGGAGEGRQIPGRAGRTKRRGETALPDGPAIKGRRGPASLPPRFPALGKCTSHLGFGLGGAAGVELAEDVPGDGEDGPVVDFEDYGPCGEGLALGVGDVGAADEADGPDARVLSGDALVEDQGVGDDGTGHAAGLGNGGHSQEVSNLPVHVRGEVFNSSRITAALSMPPWRVSAARSTSFWGTETRRTRAARSVTDPSSHPDLGKRLPCS